MHVFGRKDSSHPFANSVSQLLSASDVEYRAMAVNTMCDTRVTRERDLLLQKTSHERNVSDNLQDALVVYHSDRIRNRELPDFVFDKFNGDNVITRRGMGLVNRDLWLSRVIDLNGLGPVLRDAARGYGSVAPNPLLASFPRPRLGSHAGFERVVARWFDQRLTSPGKIQFWVNTILETLAARSKHAPYQPSWCSTWESVRHLENEPPETWFRAFGVRSQFSGHWLVMLRYRVREVGTLVRPTQLEAGWYSLHFPSPPHASLAAGGHPVELENGVQGELIPEYIHRQISHTWNHVVRVARTDDITDPDVHDVRQSHHRRLRARYGDGKIRSWMADPTEQVGGHS